MRAKLEVLIEGYPAEGECRNLWVEYQVTLFAPSFSAGASFILVPALGSSRQPNETLVRHYRLILVALGLRWVALDRAWADS